MFSKNFFFHRGPSENWIKEPEGRREGGDKTRLLSRDENRTRKNNKWYLYSRARNLNLPKVKKKGGKKMLAKLVYSTWSRNQKSPTVFPPYFSPPVLLPIALQLQRGVYNCYTEPETVSFSFTKNKNSFLSCKSSPLTYITHAQDFFQRFSIFLFTFLRIHFSFFQQIPTLSSFPTTRISFVGTNNACCHRLVHKILPKRSHPHPPPRMKEKSKKETSTIVSRIEEDYGKSHQHL